MFKTSKELEKKVGRPTNNSDRFIISALLLGFSMISIFMFALMYLRG